MTQWQTFLTNLKAEIAEGRVQHFGNPADELQATANGTILADLSHLGLLQIEGEDRIDFLQGQVTNDVKLLTGNNSHYAGYCTPKGRLLAFFMAFAHHNHLHLQLNRQLLEPIMKRLKMYVLRSKVSITDVSDSIVRMGLAGPQATELLQGLFNQAPENAQDLVSLEDAALIRLPGDSPRFEIFTAPEHAERIWNALSQQATMVGAPCWDWLEIQAGIPEIYPNTQEAFVPQMINLDTLGGINYKKGCYTGQEIVARTHYLGKVKRRTLLLHIPQAHISEASEVNVNMPVYSSRSEEPAGVLVRAAPSPNGGWDALAELRLEAIEDAEIYLNKASGIALTRRELPYVLI
jgi:tRNA-modifying protein YgfZ